MRSTTRARLAVLVLALFSLGGLLWLLVQSSFLDLEEVEVRGTRHTSPAEVRGAAGLEKGEPLLLVGRGRVAGRVERLPWVARARVSFSLPATLVIAVEERAAVAWVRAGKQAGEQPTEQATERLALVDAQGRVLEDRTTPPARLTLLDVEVKVPAPGRRIEGGRDPLAIAATVPAALAPRVQAVARARDGWALRVEGAGVVRFGPATELSRKWAALEAVLSRLGDRHVASIDVRAPSVPAVREHEDVPTTTTTTLSH